MGLYRCQNEDCAEDTSGRLIFDFEADKPVCPKCGTDGRKPEGRHIVVKRVLIHFLAKDKTGPIRGHKGRHRIACNGEINVLGRDNHGTTVPWDVNCPECRKTQEWLDLAAQNVENVWPEGDFPVEIDTEKGVVRVEESASTDEPSPETRTAISG